MRRAVERVAGTGIGWVEATNQRHSDTEAPRECKECMVSMGTKGHLRPRRCQSVLCSSDEAAIGTLSRAIDICST